MIKAVFFDAFRTIFDTLGTHTGATKKILEKMNLDIDYIEFHEKWDDFIVQNWRSGGPFRKLWPIFEECLDMTFGHYGIEEYDSAEAIKFWLDLVASAPPFKDAEQAVALVAAKYKTAIVSNSDNFEMKMCLDRFDAQFDAVFTSEDIRSYKPRPELFSAALEHFKISRDEAVMVGDSLSADIDGARAMGIRSVWINRTGKPLPAGRAAPDYELPGLAGLPALVDSIQ